MMRFFLHAAIIFFMGCSTKSSVCNFNLLSNDWSPVDRNSNDKIKPLNELDGSGWYKNSNGDYLICHFFISKKECGGIYELFTKQADQKYEYKDVLCME